MFRDRETIYGGTVDKGYIPKLRMPKLDNDTKGGKPLDNWRIERADIDRDGKTTLGVRGIW